MFGLHICASRFSARRGQSRSVPPPLLPWPEPSGRKRVSLFSSLLSLFSLSFSLARRLYPWPTAESTEAYSSDRSELGIVLTDHSISRVRAAARRSSSSSSSVVAGNLRLLLSDVRVFEMTPNALRPRWIAHLAILVLVRDCDQIIRFPSCSPSEINPQN